MTDLEITRQLNNIRGEINQHVDPVGVPALTQQSPGADQAAGDSLLEHRGDQPDVEPWTPLAPQATNHPDAVFGLGQFQFDISILLDQPRASLFQEIRSQVIIDQYG